MSRELRSRLLTLLVLAAVAAAVFVYARREDLLSAPRPRSGLLYPGLDAGALTFLHLGLTNRQDLQLERTPGGLWRITQPTTESPRQYLVETIIDYLARAQVEPVEQTGPPLRADQVGLEPPRCSITFGADDRRETLLLGEVDPLGRAVYARRSGTPEIVLATRNLVTHLESNGEDFVDPALLRGLQGPATSLRVVHGDGSTLAARREGDRWTLVEPAAVLGDDSRLQQLVRSLQFVQQQRVLLPHPSAAALHDMGLPDAADVQRGEQHGATRLEVSAEGEPTVGAWLAAGWQARPAEVPAVRDGLQKVVEVPRASLAMLANAPDFYREHHVLPPIRERTESVRIDSAGQTTLDIRRDEAGRWTFAAPGRLAGQDVESGRMEGHSLLSEFLGRIDGLEAQGFTGPPAGEPVGQLTIGWTRAGERRQDRIELFAPRPDGGVPARTTERPNEGLILPAAALELLDPLQADLLRPITPLRLDAAQWGRLEIRSPGAAEPLVMARDSKGNWSGDDALGRRYGVAKDLLRGFRGFRWQRAHAGAEHPYSIRFLGDDGAELFSLALRLPAADEPQEAFGYPTALAEVSGHPDVELVIAREWVDRVVKLWQPPVREP